MGSYGLPYTHRNNFMDDFGVWVQRRGPAEKREDPFLTPSIPSVEDPGVV
ncbi:MAG TPA: Imm7 family immunity protein [Chloroflexota bacterium]